MNKSIHLVTTVWILIEIDITSLLVTLVTGVRVTLIPEPISLIFLQELLYGTVLNQARNGRSINWMNADVTRDSWISCTPSPYEWVSATPAWHILRIR